MATVPDLNIDLLKWENRSFQHAFMERSVSQEEALRRLTEMVSHNTEQIEALTKIGAENQRQIAALNEKMDRLMTHLDVPPKPPAGFVKE